MDQRLFGSIAIVVRQLIAHLNAVFGQQHKVWLVSVEYGFGDKIAVSRVIDESS